MTDEPGAKDNLAPAGCMPHVLFTGSSTRYTAPEPHAHLSMIMYATVWGAKLC